MLFRAQSSGCKENKRHPIVMVAVGMAVKSDCTGRVLYSASLVSLCGSWMNPQGKFILSIEDIRFHYSSNSWATDVQRTPLGSK